MNQTVFSTSQTLYHVLGLTSSATKQSIRVAYLKLAKKHHPDSPSGGDVEKFKQLNHAYETLHDDSQRRSYDLSFSQQQSGGSATASSSSSSFYQQNSYWTARANSKNAEDFDFNAQPSSEDYIKIRKTMFSDPMIKKRAAEKDVNQSNAYRRFYEEWYSDPIKQHRRKIQMRYNERVQTEYRSHQQQQSRQKQAGPFAFGNSSFSYSQHANSANDSSESEFAKDDVSDVKKKAYMFLTGDVLLLLMVISVVATKWIQKQQEQHGNQKLPASQQQR